MGFVPHSTAWRIYCVCVLLGGWRGNGVWVSPARKKMENGANQGKKRIQHPENRGVPCGHPLGPSLGMGAGSSGASSVSGIGFLPKGASSPGHGPKGKCSSRAGRTSPQWYHLCILILGIVHTKAVGGFRLSRCLKCFRCFYLMKNVDRFIISDYLWWNQFIY